MQSVQNCVKERKLLAIPLLLSSLTFQGGGQPINIPIPNPPTKLGYFQAWSEDLGVTPAQFQEYKPGYAIAGIYSLTVSLVNDFPNYPDYFVVTLSFGTQEMCNHEVWGIQINEQATFICLNPGYLVVDKSLNCEQNPCTSGSVQGNEHLKLTLSGRGWPIDFKSVSLTFTPQ